MKKVLLTLLFIFSIHTITKIQAQYIPMAVDSAVWLMEKVDMFGNILATSAYYTDGDTVFNNLNYKRVYFTDDNNLSHIQVGLIRDDVATETVHAIGTSGCPFSDVKTYDFSVSSDTTIIICASPLLIFEVETIFLYGKNRRQLYIDGPAFWVEGIGDLRSGPLRFANTGFRLADYCRGTIEDCGVAAWVSTNETKTFQQGKLFPNPARDQVRLELGHYIQNGTIKIIDTFGRVHQLLGFEGNESRIDVADLAHGIYIVQVFENDELRYSDKLMVID